MRPSFFNIRFILHSFLCIILVAACSGMPKHERPLSTRTQQILDEKGLKIQSPIFIQILKTENKLEVYKADETGKYVFLRSWDICAYSGDLGPKLKQGDRQAPEGIYMITPKLMNPWSNYHLAINLGYPNKYDQAYGRTGAHLMVHGECSSRGCYAMENGPIEDIYGLMREAFKGGQRAIQIQALPFRMSDENLAPYKNHKWYDFWQNLKEGTDIFASTQRPPKMNVCNKRYIFAPQGSDISLECK